MSFEGYEKKYESNCHLKAVIFSFSNVWAIMQLDICWNLNNDCCVDRPIHQLLWTKTMQHLWRAAEISSDESSLNESSLNVE